MAQTTTPSEKQIDYLKGRIRNILRTKEFEFIEKYEPKRREYSIEEMIEIIRTEPVSIRETNGKYFGFMSQVVWPGRLEEEKAYEAARNKYEEASHKYHKQLTSVENSILDRAILGGDLIGLLEEFEEQISNLPL